MLILVPNSCVIEPVPPEAKVKDWGWLLAKAKYSFQVFTPKLGCTTNTRGVLVSLVMGISASFRRQQGSLVNKSFSELLMLAWNKV